MSIKNPNDPTREQTCDLPACSAVSQPTASLNTTNIKTGVLEIKLGEGGQCLN